nr:acetyl-CoA carboxylase subunit [Syringa komarowii]ANA08846.1 acetyl-CoA carboxylase subunit [Syringa x prestoniae]
MKRWWFNSMVFKKELERGYGINKSMNNLGPIEIENTSKSEDPNRKAKNIHSWRGRDNHSWRGRDNSSYSNVDHLFGIKDIRKFLVRDSNGDDYSIYFDSENQIFEIYKDYSFRTLLSELESTFSEFTNRYPDYDYNRYRSDTPNSWNSHINRSIYSNLHSKIYMDYMGMSIVRMDTPIVSMDTPIESLDTYKGQSLVSDGREFYLRKELEGTQKYKHLWRLCDNCEQLNYNKLLKERKDICEFCGYHLKMSSLDRIKLSIDPGTWRPMDEHMFSLDPIGWDDSEEEEPYRIEIEEPYLLIPGTSLLIPDTSHPIDEDMVSVSLDPPIGWDDSEEEPDQDRIEEEPDQDRIEEEPDQDRIEEEEKSYKDRIDSYRRETGKTEAVQTGIGLLNNRPVAIGVMDFEFMGGSMGSVVGEKITRLIEYATIKRLPLIIVCASGGARMQEGSLSLMQMAKISSALYDYQSNKKLFYVSILTSPTTGGVTASFGMLGDIVIAEPNAYIAFAGKRVIEQLLNIIVPEGAQETENLFEKGSFDLIVPRNSLKSVLTELFKLHGVPTLMEISRRMPPENLISMLPKNSISMLPKNSIRMLPENSIRMLPENSIK